MFRRFSLARAVRFAREPAGFVHSESSDSLHNADAEVAGGVEKVLDRAHNRMHEFNQRLMLADAFLWTLNDGGCSQGHAGPTKSLTMRL